MISYRHLRRNPVDEYFHRGMFVFYAMLTQLIPFSVELRTYVTVVVEALANLCKYFFRPSDEAHRIIQEVIREFRQTDAEPDVEKVAIITGGTSGIGKVMATAVAQAGFHLVLPVRNRPKAEQVVREIQSKHAPGARITLMDCDLESLDSVRSFAEQFRATRLPINLLINNAGVFYGTTRKTIDGLEPNMAINFVSHHQLTELLLPIIESGPKTVFGTRIINVSSASFYSVPNLTESEMLRRHWWEKFAPYARSKFAQVLYTRELSRRVNASRVTVNCMEPGMVNTDIYRYDTMATITFKWFLAVVAPFIMLKPEEGAVTGVWLALSPDVHAISGKIFSDLHEIPLGSAIGNIDRVQPEFISTLTARAIIAAK